MKHFICVLLVFVQAIESVDDVRLETLAIFGHGSQAEPVMMQTMRPDF